MKVKNRQKMIAARVTDREFKAISDESRKRGQRKSTFIREMILAHMALYAMSK